MNMLKLQYTCGYEFKRTEFNLSSIIQYSKIDSNKHNESEFPLYMDLFYDNISWLIIRDTNE